MRYVIQYSDESERNEVIDENKDNFLIEERKHFNGNFLVFSDIKPLSEEVTELKVRQDLTENALLDLILGGM